ncbi:hypothetical protein MY4038_009611 [Beauveria bassiana]
MTLQSPVAAEQDGQGILATSKADKIHITAVPNPEMALSPYPGLSGDLKVQVELVYA